MNFKANYKIVNLQTGENVFPLSEGTSTIHQVYCIEDGSVTVTALGSGTATFAMTVNEKIDVMTRNVTVVGGTFIGFGAKHD